MTLKTWTFSRVLITSAILISYLWGAFQATWGALMDSISNNDIWQVAIEQSVQQEESSNFLSSIFSIPQAHADNISDTSVYSKLKDIKGSVFEQSIVKAYQKWIIKWYNDWKFYPNNPVSFIESLAILIKSGPKGAQIVNYQKSTDTHWSDAYKALYNSQDKTNLKSFRNDDKITRDFALYLMLRQIWVTFNDSDFSKIPNKFQDVTSNSKFAPYLAFWGYVWITNWYQDGSFWWNKNVSRWELTTMAYRTLIDNKDSILQKYNELMWSQGTTTQQPQVEVKQEVKASWYVVNEKWQKTGYNQASVTVKSYSELSKVLSEKWTVDYNNYKYRSVEWNDKFIPQPFQYINTSADEGFSVKFYKYMEEMKSQWKEISLPLYLIPDFTYGWLDWKTNDQLSTKWITIDTKSIGSIDINNYSNLKLIVDNYLDINRTSTTKYDNLVVQDLVKLLNDQWISDYSVNWNVISYNWADWIFKYEINAKYINEVLKKNLDDWRNSYEKVYLVNQYTRYKGWNGIAKLIDIYLQKLSGYTMERSSNEI